MTLTVEEKACALSARLLDVNMPFARRYRSLFSIRNLPPSDASRRALVHVVLNLDGDGGKVDHGTLLRHEAAYVLGQTQDKDAEVLRALKRVLHDVDDDVMVRHEAAEALGCIGTDACRKAIHEFTWDDNQEVRETCLLAVQRIGHLDKERDAQQGEGEGGGFKTIDPTPAKRGAGELSESELGKLLMDEEAEMFERYGAVFALRNKKSDTAVELLVSCMQKSKSALLKHELAFVLGQLQDNRASEALIGALRDTSEHSMVRHEAAEALGAVAASGQDQDKIDRAVELLKEFAQDGTHQCVAQSCQVALDMLKSEVEGEFEYCDTLQDLAGPGEQDSLLEKFA